MTSSYASRKAIERGGFGAQVYNAHGGGDARCLTDSIALYTAWANDAACEDVFLNQLQGLLNPEDVVVAISVPGAPGFSADPVWAVRYANQLGAATVSLMGLDGGLLHRESTCSIRVAVESTPQTEALQLVIEHLLKCLP